jgi:hypothetical protein
VIRRKVMAPTGAWMATGSRSSSMTKASTRFGHLRSRARPDGSRLAPWGQSRTASTGSTPIGPISRQDRCALPCIESPSDCRRRRSLRCRSARVDLCQATSTLKQGRLLVLFIKAVTSESADQSLSMGSAPPRRTDTMPTNPEAPQRSSRKAGV